MSICQIRFLYCQKDVVIRCKRSELLKDIISLFGTKSKLSVEEFCFLYQNQTINPDLTLAQINNKDEEILIFVCPNKNKENENKIKESDYIKCEKYGVPAIVEFLNDYSITLTDGKHDKKIIKLYDYNNTQIIDQSKIKCSKCSKSKLDKNKNKFYYCFECKKNFCFICQSSHKKHKNIVDYPLKYFRCMKHFKELNSFCLDCKKNLCISCSNQHKEHNKIDFNNLSKEENKELIEKILEVKELADSIIYSLQKFKDNLDVYVKINEKLNENIKNMNFNYEILKSMKNLMEISFLKKDINQILKSKDINEKFKKIMSIYDIMNSKPNEITFRIKVEKNDLNKTIYFLDNTQESDGEYNENGNYVKHNHDNLKEINENNTTLIIDGKTIPFKKFFIPKITGIYSIKLIFKNKLSNCAYMFYNCKNIIEIDFSRFNMENITNMQSMFDSCSGLKSLNLEYFETRKVTNMSFMFYNCSLLTSLDLKSFNTNNVTNMMCMFGGDEDEGCCSLTTINLTSFNTQNVSDMYHMFYNCSSLTTLNLTSFKTDNVISMNNMFAKCFSLTSLNLSSFNADNADTSEMFDHCINLFSCGCSDKQIVERFKNRL